MISDVSKIGSRGPRKTIENRFWGKVDRAGEADCWLWTGACTRLGYGNFWDGTYTDSLRPRMVEAHRWAYTHFVADPGEMNVRHTCDVRACVNFTAHLILGTHADNMRDLVERGRWGGPRNLSAWDNPNRRRKLTPEQVLSIRELGTQSAMSHQTIADQFGISRQYISSILANKVWVPH